MANTPTSPSIEELRLREVRRGTNAVLDAVTRLSPNYERPVHMRALADFFASVARGEPCRLVFSSAPRFAKTTTIEHGIAWLMFVRPGIRVVLVSCTAFLAEQISARIRSLVQQLGVRIGRDQRSVEMWAAANGSSLRAIGTGGALVGVGADLLVCDDLVPSLAAANSPTECERAESWFVSTALGRLAPGAAVLFNMHRWSVQDLSSRLIERGWPWCNVPAVDRVTGESNWPAQWSTDELRSKEREVGPLVWSALYCGMPRPSGSAVFIGGPHYYDLDEVQWHLAHGSARLAIGVDPAATAKTSADYSVMCVAAFIGSTMNVLDVVRGQWEVPVLVDRIAHEQRRWRAVVGVESVGGFKSVGQYLRRANPRLMVFDVKRTVDKLTASIPASAAWARGEILLPPAAPWLDDFVREVFAFSGTGTGHDDQVDAMCIAQQLQSLAAQAERRRHQLRALSRSLPFA